VQKGANSYSRREDSPENIRNHAKLRAEQSEIERQIHNLSVKRGDKLPLYPNAKGATGTVKIDTELSLLRARTEAMRAKAPGADGAAEDEFGYQTKEYARLLDRTRVLRDQRAKQRKTSRTKHTIRQRPASVEEQIRKELEEFRTRKSPEDELRDELNKFREEQKVRGGG
jgi:hypothetical protein